MSTRFAPTEAQRRALAAYATGEAVRMTAGAGSGKTSTLDLLARDNLGKSCMYIAFNKAIQTEAAARFPRNVTCKTAHSLAFREFGAPLRDRLFPAPARVSNHAAARILGIDAAFVAAPATPAQPASPERPKGVEAVGAHLIQASAMAGMAIRTMKRFSKSTDGKIGLQHFVVPDGLESAPNIAGLTKLVVELAVQAWADVTSPSGRLRCEHDYYLKLWAASHPRLNYDVIFVDEAQDLDPVMADVMNRQLGHVQMVAVGDAAQSIYRWRGSVDWLTTFPAKHEVMLDTSFRFGQAVAAEANVWLAHVGGPLRIKGNPAKQSAVVTDSMTDPDAILCRSNAGAIAAVMGQIRDRRQVGLVGGTAELKFLITSVEALQQGREATHPDLIGFNTWPEVEEYAQTDDGADLVPLVKLVNLHGTRALLNAIDSCVPEDRAEVVVSTAHKAKGRQWPNVMIWGDFYPPKDDPDTGVAGLVSDEEAMLAYVAVTRAEQTLDNGGLAWIHDAKYDDQRTTPAVQTPALPPKARVPPLRARVSSTGPEPLPVPAVEYDALVSF